MGVMRVEPRRFTDWTARSVGAAWRAYDPQLTVYAALLAVIGLVMAYSNTVNDGARVLDTGTTFTRGLMWAGIAIVVFVTATIFDYHWLKTFRWPLYFANLGLLVLTLAIGDGVGGSARWVGFGPFQFQFSELAKILMIAVLAAYLGSREGRLVSFLDPAHDLHGSGWQVFQSMIAVGSGGLVGTGLTNGTQNRGQFLPVQESDFVAAVLFEELGFLGAVMLFLLFGALMWRIVVAGWRSKDPF